MTLDLELHQLDSWVKYSSSNFIQLICAAGAPMYCLDFVMVGALKRTLSLADGISAMIKSQNMGCARAILRMQLDTVSRLLAYTYVDNPEQMARAVIGGSQIKQFKSRDGRKLLDGYLIDQLTKEYPWARKVYDFTSGYVHFSEKQFFDSVVSAGGDGGNNLQLVIGQTDSKFSEDSWIETLVCFNHLLKIIEKLLDKYSLEKTA